MREEERAIERIGGDGPGAEAAQDGGGEGDISCNLPGKLSTIEGDSTLDDVGEKGFIRRKEAGTFGFMARRCTPSVGVVVQLVDLGAPAGAARRHDSIS